MRFLRWLGCGFGVHSVERSGHFVVCRRKGCEFVDI